MGMNNGLGRLVSRRWSLSTGALKKSACTLMVTGLAATAQAGTVSAVADAFVRDGQYAATNYGGANPMEAKTEIADWNRDIFVKFDISGEAPVSSAVLAFIGATDTAGASQSVNVHAVADTAWSEGQITWNNRPALGSQIGSVNVSGTTFAKYSVDVTSYVKTQQAAGKSTVTLAFHNATSSNVRFLMKSREDASSKPSLTLVAAANPAPTSTPPPTSNSAASLGSIEDGFVRDGKYASTSYGSTSPLEVKTETPDWSRDAYLKFDTTSVGTINSASLTVYAATDTDGATLDTNIHAVSSSSWIESGLTWNNRPTMGSAIARLTTRGTAFAKYTIDLTNYVKSERAAGRYVITVGLHNPSASNVRLLVKSREDASNKPVLMVSASAPTATPVPTAVPATPAPSTPAPEPMGQYPVVVPTNGTHYYVSTSGNDASNGSKSSPWRTISKAVKTARGGSQPVVIHVGNGTYSETVRIPTTFSGTASARTYLVSDTRFGAKIRGSADAAVTIKANYIDMIGFDVSGTARIGVYNDPNIGYSRVISNKVHDILATGCNSSGGAGILSDYWSGGKYLDAIGNHVYNIGPAVCNTVHGIYHSTKGGLIQNNVVGRVSGWGIHLWHAASDVTITNNTVFNAASGAIVVGAGDSPGGVTASNCKVHNNIVRDSKYGIYEYGAVASSNAYSNNLVFNTPTAISLQGKSATGTVSGDPLMVDYRADGLGDYHLRSTSPAIDRGASNASVPNVDFDANARPRGAGNDIGAYEWY